MLEKKFNFKAPGSKDFNNKTDTTIAPELRNYKTLLQLAKEIGVDKQKVYRCLKRYNMTYHLIDEVMYIDEATQTDIKTLILNKKEKSHEIYQKIEHDVVLKQLETVINILKNELEIKSQQLKEKDKQIFDLTKLLDQEQQIRLLEKQNISNLN